MILAGDVGGTKVRLALFEKKGGQYVDETRFASKEFSDFASLVKKFLEKQQGKEITCASFGVAGPVHKGVCKATNLPWMISASDLEKQLKIPKVYLMNDLVANAWGLRCLNEDEFFTINAGEAGEGNQALVSAGTGLGEAGLFYNGMEHLPFPCEGGHCDFGPTSEEEIDLLRYLLKQFPHVSYERVLSGPGLYNIYRFLIDTQREKEDPAIAALMKQGEPARVITDKGASGACKACVRACQLFVSIYGSEAGNTALKFFAVGGVFLGGGIAPHLTGLFKEGKFMKEFVNKGRLSSVLMKIPVKVVLNEKTALLGAARFAQVKL